MSIKNKLQVAETILNQMGGSMLIAMLGVTNLTGSRDSLMFRFKGSRKANHLRVTLRADDTYTMTFSKVRGLLFAEVETFEGVYCDMLCEVFEHFTGLATSLVPRVR